MASLKISSDWIASDENFRPEFDQSYGQLGIRVDDDWITEYETESGSRGERLEVPAYPLAEWIAENWWSLLYEPAKGDRSRKDPGFRSRHWMGSARDGFALPDGWICSLGRGSVRVESRPAYFPHARLVLRNTCDAQLRTDDVAAALAGFVDSVVERLNAAGITETGLQAIWGAFKSIDADEHRFCRLLGALGMSPYDAAPDISELITGALGDVSEQVAEDFCEAADVGDALEAAADVVQTLAALDGESELDFTDLFSLKSRGDRTPRRMALEAVKSARERFSIAAGDPQGGEQFLQKLALNAIVRGQEGVRDMDEPVLHGSLRRTANTLRFNLIRKQLASRRYDAARACYLAWIQASDGDRLVTRARVPDQQASRIFAAELLAPIEYIRSRTRNNVLSPYGAAEIADTLCVSDAVVSWQASHNRISVVGQHGGQWG
ncbi:hypothetical protein MKK69_05235 [Methylobacterium sp. J-026]|uniref:hypothetical protein n=1 Tax=Methylobacterium sp. J-026 TaxID=2836624 RepID=UPI001FBAA203|nr:hypothetical protein [Methylobacterium sp. J-026]MCJ2133473.1 hypothetical protein [Methylobacterium sp. J-026]